MPSGRGAMGTAPPAGSDQVAVDGLDGNAVFAVRGFLALPATSGAVFTVLLRLCRSFLAACALRCLIFSD